MIAAIHVSSIEHYGGYIEIKTSRIFDVTILSSVQPCTALHYITLYRTVRIFYGALST
jgi:hypothetical protein